MTELSSNNEWGEILPGTVFWQDVESATNQILLDTSNKARRLAKPELLLIRRKIARLELSLADWDYRSYDRRIAWMRARGRSEEDPQRRRDIAEQLQALIDNPPAKPQRVWPWQRNTFQVIENERQAQKMRLWLDRARQRILEHETAMRNEQIYNELANEMLLEVGYFGQQIVRRWTALANREEIYTNNKRIVKMVKLEAAYYTPDEIQYKIRVSSRGLLGAVQHHLPDRVSAWNLVKPETLSELSAACERPVSSPHHENTPEAFENGAWVIVYREGLTDGLFDLVEYDKIMTKYDSTERVMYPVPLGVKRGRVVEWLRLAEQPHIMINGIPGSGKTNWIRGFVATLARYHSPSEMRFYLCDLKRGGDMRAFAGIPHLAAPIILQLEHLEELVPQLVATMQTRMDTFYQAAATDINDYNQMVEPAQRLPRIAIVIDECNSIDNLARAAKSKSSADLIWRGLTLIATQARAAGMHLVLGTQQSFSDSIPKSVRDNITFVLSGRQRTLAGSLATFGSGQAKRLPAIRGRMWCDDGNELFQIQTPFIAKPDIDVAVAVAMQYGPAPELELVQPDGSSMALLDNKNLSTDDILRIAIEDRDGRLSVVPIHELVSKQASRRQVQALIEEITSQEEWQYASKIWHVVRDRNAYRLVQSPTRQLANHHTSGELDGELNGELDHQEKHA